MVNKRLELITHSWSYQRYCCCCFYQYNNTSINTLRPKQIAAILQTIFFQCISLNENIWNSIEMSLKFVPKGPINNIPALVQIMSWRRRGDKPLSEPMMVRLLTHICVIRPQWHKQKWIRDKQASDFIADSKLFILYCIFRKAHTILLSKILWQIKI